MELVCCERRLLTCVLPGSPPAADNDRNQSDHSSDVGQPDYKLDRYGFAVDRSYPGTDCSSPAAHHNQPGHEFGFRRTYFLEVQEFDFFNWEG